MLALACGGETATTPPDSAGSDLVTPTDALAEVEAPDVAAPDTVEVDVPVGEDVAADVAVEPDAAPPPDTTPDVTEAPECCAVDEDCDNGERCVGGGESPVGQCMKSTPVGTCFSNDQCGLGQLCEGVVAPKCGAGVPTPGTCADSFCCFETGYCPTNMECQDAWCVQGNAVNGSCLGDDNCSQIGWICKGATPITGDCHDPTAVQPEYGTCVPGGPGGQCLTVVAGQFGDCDTPLGWAWIGTGCATVSGCDCGAACDSLYATEEECVTACSPPICCEADADCASGQQCHAGHCVSTPTTGACFRDSDCEAGSTCAGESTCPCGDKWCGLIDPGFLCDTPPCLGDAGFVHPGVCIPKPTCCETDLDCGDGNRCVASPYATPRCEPAPEAGRCFTVNDCGEAEYCANPKPCGCEDTECVSVPGECLPKPAGCCVTSADCAEGQACTAVPLGDNTVAAGSEVGQCVAALGPGDCYTDDACAPDEDCEGFMGLPCGTPIGSEASVGHCVKSDGKCCGFTKDCAEGLACVWATPASGQVCKPVPDPGYCWTVLDCEAGQVCQGASACGACSSICSGGGQMGVCGEPDEACCTSDADCAEGLWCTAQPSFDPFHMPGVAIGQCVTPPKGGGACLSHAHCGKDQVCSGFSGLPCGADASPEGWYSGYCLSVDGACCESDLDCPSDYQCLGVTLGDALGHEGSCKPRLDDGVSCWADSDCVGDQVCSGVFVCGCASCDAQADAAGTCVTP